MYLHMCNTSRISTIERNLNKNLHVDFKVKGRGSSIQHRNIKEKLSHNYKDTINELMLHSRKMLLISAVSVNNTELVEKLLNRGLDPNFVDDHLQITPLELAEGNDYTDIIKLLLDHGAKGNEEDPLGNTQLQMATLCTNNIKIVNMLIEASGTNVMTDFKQQTIFHFPKSKYDNFGRIVNSEYRHPKQMKKFHSFVIEMWKKRDAAKESSNKQASSDQMGLDFSKLSLQATPEIETANLSELQQQFDSFSIY